MKWLTCILLLGVTITANAAAEMEKNWQFQQTDHPESGESACQLLSKNYMLGDTENTTVRLILTRRNIYILTNANIDPSYENSGLQFGGHKPIPFSKTFNRQNAVVEDISDEVVRNLKRRNSFILNLGLWPTWPKDKTNRIRISLVGFLRAYREFKNCLHESI